MHYLAKFVADPGGGYVITFRDIPEAITQGDTEEDAMAMAEDALATAMDFYVEDQRPVPLPSRPHQGERLIALAPAVAARVAQLNDSFGQQRLCS